jgi:hypothetical protein
VLNEKWDKCRRYIGEIIGELAGSADKTLEFKALERKRGFLIYVTRTYHIMIPYLKGFHQTHNIWWPNQGEDGWKLLMAVCAIRLNGQPDRVIRTVRITIQTQTVAIPQ